MGEIRTPGLSVYRILLSIRNDPNRESFQARPPSLLKSMQQNKKEFLKISHGKYLFINPLLSFFFHSIKFTRDLIELN